MTNVQIYVGTYAKYNNGSIKGAWLDLSNYSDYDELQKAMQELHKDEQDPEFMIQDYECSKLIEELGLISECHISEEIFEIIEEIENCYYDEDVIEAYIYCTSSGSSEMQDILDKVNDCYCGEFDNDIAFTEQLLLETGDIPNELPNYVHIDWERTSFDIMMDYSTYNNHYFRNY